MHLNSVFDPSFSTNCGFPSKTPMFSTIVQRPVSGRGEIRASLQPYPLWRIEYEMEYARGGEQIPDSVYQYTLGFFLNVGGQFSDFLYFDPNDNNIAVATPAYFGTGDGTTQNFQLIRQIGVGNDIVQNLNGAPVIYGNGSVISSADYTISNTGIVQFTSAPAGAIVLQWSGDFYYRVRFGEDTTKFDQSFNQIWNNGALTLMSVIL